MNTAPQSLKVLLTGGARGVGRGLFRQLLSSGHNVVILDSNKQELDHVKDRAQEWSNGGKERWHAIHCDLSKRNEMKAAVEEVGQRFDGKLDVLINNAFPTDLVISKDRRMEAEGDEMEQEWDLKIAIGLTAPFILSRLCVPLLAAGRSTQRSPGSIINISSTRAYQSESDHEAYSAAKAGLLGLTQSMAVSLGHRHNIRVNAIVPGWIHVMDENKAADESGALWEDDLTPADATWHPVCRVGRVEHVTRAVEYLVGNEFVTGQEIVVDGGVGRKMDEMNAVATRIPNSNPLLKHLANDLCHKRFKKEIPDIVDFEYWLSRNGKEGLKKQMIAIDQEHKKWREAAILRKADWRKDTVLAEWGPDQGVKELA
ncbi:carbonyl reductase family member 4-like [Pyrenophora tritici-repentis]|nr:carbonyl reductase family member 4-like [Pyrenophora tritici-repentis]KAI0581460.1 carbonyl reductase family member 4-like [Pyrenophora tritici-repentis]KAI0609192.1 carbonyl reductase family member 4-like [Pyrenophora tritici-repentis]KAI0620049.1 carbonyl reductase family member 4-like [Pyrenophora tritici-repentis]KAI1584723.1 FabG Dehydrogenase with different specificities related to short-chain alcohol dehydrogenase [Pyrenophora tritici-repentis]